MLAVSNFSFVAEDVSETKFSWSLLISRITLLLMVSVYLPEFVIALWSADSTAPVSCAAHCACVSGALTICGCMGSLGGFDPPFSAEEGSGTDLIYPIILPPPGFNQIQAISGPCLFVFISFGG